MNLLIPYGRAADQYLSLAAQELGHRVYLLCNFSDSERLGEVGRTCLPDFWIPIATRYDLKMTPDDYLNWYHEQLRECVSRNKIDAILPCSSMDLIINQVAQVNEEFDLSGIRPNQAEFYRDKSTYLPAMINHGVRVPEIYEIVEPQAEPKNYDLPFPVIAKPGLGSGGYGIYIAENENLMRWFFGPSDNPGAFSDRAMFYQDRDFSGLPKTYLHYGFGGKYIIQEHIPGPCISLAGTTVNGIPKVDLVYDIGISPPPTCAEVDFGWPSIHREAEVAARELVSSLEGIDPPLPDGAWMADAILNDGKLWLVDFAPRMSSSGTKMMYHTTKDLSYAKNVINASMGKSDQIIKPNPTCSTFYSFIPFAKGKIMNVRYPNHEFQEAVLPVRNGSRVYEMRNDLQVADRGWVVASSETDSRESVQDTVQEFINNISYDTE